MSPNMGFSTDVIEGAWKDVSITTEIAIFEYQEMRDEAQDDEEEYDEHEQLTLF